jgi:hypothetical protein
MIFNVFSLGHLLLITFWHAGYQIHTTSCAFADVLNVSLLSDSTFSYLLGHIWVPAQAIVYDPL